MSIFRFLGIALVLSLGACTTSTPAGTDTVDGSYKRSGFRWGSGTLSAVAVKVREEAGTTILCGAFVVEGVDVFTGEIAVVVRQGGGVRHGGTRLLSGLSALAGPYDAMDGLNGRQANCVDTGVAWRDEFADPASLRMTSPRNVVL